MTVTPLAGVWIEIASTRALFFWESVTPLAGVWIEIHTNVYSPIVRIVTPLAGVWIEISFTQPVEVQLNRHSPRGSVD